MILNLVLPITSHQYHSQVNMAQGLAIPIYPIQGRAALETDSRQLQKILMLQLSDCENANPFNQDVGIDGGIVFQTNDAALQALIRARIVETFRTAERAGRAKLVNGFPTFSEDSETQELTCSVRYVNLETEQEEDMSFKPQALFGLPTSGTR
jgi:hypothetical protein